MFFVNSVGLAHNTRPAHAFEGNAFPGWRVEPDGPYQA